MITAVILDSTPITTAAMRKAAELWADVRSQGLPTADRQALDIDVVLAGQSLTSGIPTGDFVVATGNVGHLSRCLLAKLWSSILP